MIIDNNGNEFATLAEALSSYGFVTGGSSYARLRMHGKVCVKGITFTEVDKKLPTPQPLHDETSILAKLRKRYTSEEISQLIKGEGIARDYHPFPKISLRGKHHRVLVISDTHIGSVYSPEEWHDVVSEYANNPDNNIECILHCGDLVDGLKIGREMQIYELSDIGYDAQKDKAIELMSKYKVPMYVISGNHDMYFKASAGANIVQAVCDAVPNLTYVGHDTADIDVDGVTIRMFHGTDGSAYALSYSLQKLIEGMSGRIPGIVVRGHIHKFVNFYDSGKRVYAVSCPAMQTQTAYLRGKKIQVHTGFLVMDFETDGGSIRNFSITHFPFEQ